MARTSFVDVALRLRGARRFNAEVAAATKQLEAMGIKGAASMGAFAAKAERFKSVGRSLTMGVTLPIVAASAAAIKLSMDYNATFGRIDRLVGVTGDALESWREDVLGISDQTAVAAEELGDALFYVASAGLRGSTAIDALRESARASAAGLGETKVIADAVTSAMNAYGPAVLSASQATDVLIAAVSAGKMDPAALAGTIGSVIPVAQAMGVSFDQAAAAMAVMTKAGQPATKAATQVAGILLTFAKPTTDMETALSEMGMTIDGVRNALANKGLVPTIAMLRNEAAKAGIDLSKIFGNRRALTGVLQLTRNVKATDKVMRQVRQSAGATDEAFGKLGETRGFPLRQALNQLQNELIRIGDELGPVILPQITGLLNAIGGIARVASKAPKPLKIMVAAFFGLAAILGPVVWSVGVFAKAFGGILIVAPKVMAAIQAIRLQMAILNVVLLANPVILIVAGIVALIAVLTLAYFKIGWFRKGVDAVFSWLKGAVVTVIDFVKNNWKMILIALTGPVGLATALIIKHWSKIKGAAIAVVGFVVGRFKSLVNFYKSIPGAIASAATGMFDGIKNAFRAAINFIIDAWNGLSLRVPEISVFGKTIGGFEINTPDIPRLADGGTVARPGTVMVGERGPELLALPRAASVIPLGGQGGPARIEVPVYLNGRQIALAVADEVSNAKARS